MKISFILPKFCFCFTFSFMPNGAKNWCFTLNNYSDDEYSRIQDFINDECGYGIIGKEVGESGTPHLQCYVQCRARRSLVYLKRSLGNRCHFEIARGSPEQNRKYCSKEGKFSEFGEYKTQGQRTDIVSFVDSAKKGISWEEALESHPNVIARYGRFADRVIGRYCVSRDWVPEVYVYWGETGTGKSRKAFEEAVNPYVHSGGNWFDGYQSEADVIFDDFGGSEFKLTYLLKLLDRYPMRVPVKGGFSNWVPRRVFITSNYSPKEWYPNAKDEHVKALLRRITKVTVFRKLINANLENKDEDEVIIV